MATHSSTLAWRIPWIETGRLQFTESHRVRHDLAHTHTPCTRVCTSGFHFHLLFIFPRRHCNSFCAVRLWEFNQRAPDPIRSELWGQEVGCRLRTQYPFCYTSPSPSLKNAHISSEQLHYQQAFHRSGFSSLFTYSATTLGGLSWAPMCNARVTPVPALVASQLIRRHLYIQPLFIESLYVSGIVLEDVGDSAGKRTIKYLPSRS